MTVPSGRGRTRPVTAMQNSLRSVSAVANVAARSGIAHDLHEALAVAQVDEDDAAVVAAAMDPAQSGDGLVEMAAVDAATVVGAFHLTLFSATRTGAMRARSRGAAHASLPRGATTPIEMTYFSASSTVMSSSRTFDFGTITK